VSGETHEFQKIKISHKPACQQTGSWQKNNWGVCLGKGVESIMKFEKILIYLHYVLEKK
jgi:hypothetical protein